MKERRIGREPVSVPVAVRPVAGKIGKAVSAPAAVNPPSPNEAMDAARKPRILHLLWDGHTGGTQRYVDGIARGSLDRWETMVCVFADFGGQINQQCPYPVRSLRLSSGFSWRSARDLHRIVRDFNPDVIHLHCDSPAFLHQARRFSDRHLVYTEHGDSVVRERRQFMVSMCWKWAARHFDQVLLNSAFARDVFVRKQPGMADICTVLPNPLLGEVPARGERRPGPFRIGGIGRLHEVKGFDRLINAAALLDAFSYFEGVDIGDETHHFELHLFGDGEERPSLEALAKSTLRHNPVIFHGLTRTPLESIAGLDLLVVPSRQEAFGLTALEAQAVGTPVIATRVGGLVERIEHERTGLLCSESPESIAGAIERMMSDAPLRERLGAAAKKEAATNYSLSSHLDRLEDAYRIKLVCTI